MNDLLIIYICNLMNGWHELKTTYIAHVMREFKNVILNPYVAYLTGYSRHQLRSVTHVFFYSITL